MQASRAWTAPTGTLGRLVGEARQRAAALRRRDDELARQAASAPPPTAFGERLRQPTVSVIAEIKRRSPSKGWINPLVSAVEQARAYDRAGATVISVLTEAAHFGGSPDDLAAVYAAVSGRLPVLKKDFHVDPAQLLEARALGASAALLIVRALAPDAFATMMDFARTLPVELLVEVRDEDELRLALDNGAAVIGVNNRDLETLVIDRSTSERMLALIPSGVVAVAESGIATRDDVERVAAFGVDAVLVGSAISGVADPESAVRALTGVQRVDRGA